MVQKDTKEHFINRIFNQLFQLRCETSFFVSDNSFYIILWLIKTIT